MRLVYLAAGLLMLAMPASAQVGAEDPSHSSPDQNLGIGTGNMSQGQVTALRNYLSNTALANGTIRPGVSDDAKRDTDNLLKALSLPCTPQTASLAAIDAPRSNPKDVRSKTYEVACTNGLGYFLIAQRSAEPQAFSCFAAEATKQADVAQGREAGVTCSIQPDMKVMASTVLSRAGTTCSVRDWRWIGRSTSAHLDYTETACSDGSGYVIASAAPGAKQDVKVMSCRDATARGIACKLTVTLVASIQTFKDALTTHGVACDATNVHVIGQETTLKRHVVEFACPQQPKGLVAYIPLSDSHSPFETFDCPTAATKRHVICTLTKANGSSGGS